MDALQTIKQIIDLGIKTTPFIFDIKEDETVWIYEDAVADCNFAELEFVDKKLYLSIERFDEWKMIYVLMNFGKALVDVMDNIKRVILSTHEEMEEEVLYLYQFRNQVWYTPYGYMPYFTKWNSDRIYDYYHLPFAKPQDFLDLEYGHDLIFPSRLTYTKHNDPVFLHCQKEPSNIRFRTLPPTSFYSGSKRPVNSMTNLRQSPYLIIDLSKFPANVLKSGAPFKLHNQYYVPVVRYSLGMSNGCYFDLDQKNTQYLGTFYYWEPESNIYLNMGSKFEYFNSKIECAVFLKTKLLTLDQHMDRPDIDLDMISKIYHDLDYFLQRIYKELIENLYKYYEEESMIFEKRLGYDEPDEEELEDNLISDFYRIYANKEPKFLPISTEYTSTISGEYMKKLFYAAEDELDQCIAKALAFYNYDVVILGKMAGNYRIVSEVLDVRSRTTSLSSLCWSMI